MYEAVKHVLAEMTAQGGRDTERDLFGRPGGYKTVLSKNTVDTPCPACGTIIRKRALSGRQHLLLRRLPEVVDRENGSRIFSGGHGQPCIADQRLHWVLCGLRSGNPFVFTVCKPGHSARHHARWQWVARLRVAPLDHDPHRRRGIRAHGHAHRVALVGQSRPVLLDQIRRRAPWIDLSGNATTASQARPSSPPGAG